MRGIDKRRNIWGDQGRSYTCFGEKKKRRLMLCSFSLMLFFLFSLMLFFLFSLMLFFFFLWCSFLFSFIIFSCVWYAFVLSDALDVYFETVSLSAVKAHNRRFYVPQLAARWHAGSSALMNSWISEWTLDAMTVTCSKSTQWTNWHSECREDVSIITNS